MKKYIVSLSLFLFIFPGLLFSQNLRIDDCNPKLFPINDHQDSDGDSDVCEAKLVLENSAYYTDNSSCDQSDIFWNVRVDLWKDGVDDLEFRSDLPANDITLDDTNGNGIPDLYIAPTTDNEVVSFALPDISGASSEHGVSWSVSDECGMNDQCTIEFMVVDKKAPTPYCVSLSTVIFDNEYPMEIFAEDFNIGSFDNCTPQDEIRYSFSAEEVVPTKLLYCEEVLSSPIELQIYFWDNNDNRDYCTCFLTINPGGLDCFGDKEVYGQVRRWTGEPLEDIELRLEADLPDFPLTTTSDQNGNYTFGYLPDNIDYTLSASYDEDSYLNLVSTLDLVQIQRHILDLEPFVNPYRILASDVNNDNKISASDLLIHRKLILGVISEFPSTPPWIFIDAAYDFDDPTNPFSDLINSNINPTEIIFSEISTDGYDFIGLKHGDVKE